MTPEQLTLDAPTSPERKARRADPPTAKAAARRAFPLAGTQRRRILEAIWRAGDDGLTYDQAAERTGIVGVSVSTRISELARADWIEQAGERETASMTKAIVWRATEKAQREMAVFG